MGNESPVIGKLIWQDPITHQLREHYLRAGDVITIGRVESNDICIPERHMARHHAIIRFKDGVFTVADLDSPSGLFLNDASLREEKILNHNDILGFGGPILKFEQISNV